MGAPWFKMYAKDYLGDPKVRMLSDADRGVLVDCWAIQTEIGGVPTDPVALGKLLNRRPDHALRAFLRVACFFVHDPLKDGFMVSLRLLSEQATYSGKVQANQINGVKGGRPRKNPLGFNEKPTHGNPQITEPEPEPEPEKDKEQKNASPSAPLVPRVAKAKNEKPPKVKTTELKPESVEAFEVAWGFIPKTFRKWDQEARDYVEEPVAKGSRLIAERNFQRIVDAGVATPADLCFALQAYVLEGEMPKKGFFQHVSTFYGPEKSTYLEWLERSRQVQKEMA